MEQYDNTFLDTHRKRLNQLVESITSQDAQLNRLKAMRELAKKQTAINAELTSQLSSVNRSINEKDVELRQALNRVDNLTKRLSSSSSHSRRHSRNSRCKDSSGTENKGATNNNSNSICNGRRVSFDPLALLLDAALEGELDLVIQTSKQVPDLNASHDECVTALHNATVAGHYDVAKYLIEAGCDINVQDSDGWTPLHCAASCNNLPLVKLLIENGALIYATTTSDQSTPAMKCEKNEEGFKDCYKHLISVQNNLGVINNGREYALYDYEAQEDDELSFGTNDELTVLRRDDSEEQEWWWAQKRVQHSPSDTVVDIKEGYIPRNLVGLHPRCEAYLRNKMKQQNFNINK